MGFGKDKNKIRQKITSWNCLGYFGYGHGRGVKDFGERCIGDKSVCRDVCEKTEQCRHLHHNKMDERFPAIAFIVRQAATTASDMRRPIVETVVAAMKVAESRKVEGTEEIRSIMKEFRVSEMTDHYVAGQFENIQNGLDGNLPTFKRTMKKVSAPVTTGASDER